MACQKDSMPHFAEVERRNDGWTWGCGVSRSFTVKEAYKVCMRCDMSAAVSNSFEEGFSRIWKSFAPLKAQAMAWRLLWNRLPPMRDKIARIIDFSKEGKVCACCRMKAGSVEHSLFERPGIASLWYRIAAWIGVCWSPLRKTKEHLTYFTNLLGGGKAKRRLSGLCCVGSVRKFVCGQISVWEMWGE